MYLARSCDCAGKAISEAKREIRANLNSS